MPMRTLIWILTAVLAFTISAAQAAPSTPSPFPNTMPLYEVQPYGVPIWWNPARSGSGWFTGMLPAPGGGTLLTAAQYTYDRTGNQAWQLATGAYVRSSVEELMATGIVGRMSGPLSETAGGSCPDCPYVPPTNHPSEYGTLDLVYTSSTQASVKFSGRDMGSIAPIDLSVTKPLRDLLVGKWKGTYRVATGAAPNLAVVEWTNCTLEIVPTNNPASEDRWERRDQQVRMIPPRGGRWFELVARSCETDQFSAGRFLVLDEQTSRVLVFRPFYLAATAVPGGYQIHSLPSWGEIFLQGPDELVMREAANSTVANRPVAELLLFRVP